MDFLYTKEGIYAATGAAALVLAAFVWRAVALWLRVRPQRAQVNLAQVLRPIASRLAPKPEEAAGGEIKARMLQAGLRGAQAVELFSTVRASLALLAGVFTIVLIISDVHFETLLFLALVAALVAVSGPNWWLASRINARQQRISRALPGAIDLVLLCLEAGLSLEMAFDRTARELETVEPILADELNVMVGEINAGLPFGQALRRLADRVGLDELSLLAGLVAQATALGTSLVQTFREHAAGARTRRMLALEERAGKVSASLTLPLVLCLLPAALLSIIGPALVNLAQAMGDF